MYLTLGFSSKRVFLTHEKARLHTGEVKVGTFNSTLKDLASQERRYCKMDGIALAKVLGLTSSGLFAGTPALTMSLTDATGRG